VGVAFSALADATYRVFALTRTSAWDRFRSSTATPVLAQLCVAMLNFQIRNFAFVVVTWSNSRPHHFPSWNQSLLWFRPAVTSSPPGAAGSPYWWSR
jgi:hypothetical protein